MILKPPWQKLYPTVRRPFEDTKRILGCGFQRNLVKITRCIKTIRAGPFCPFDFDEAYNGWNQLGRTFKPGPARVYEEAQWLRKLCALLPVPVVGRSEGRSSTHTLEVISGASRF